MEGVDKKMDRTEIYKMIAVVGGRVHFCEWDTHINDGYYEIKFISDVSAKQFIEFYNNINGITVKYKDPKPYVPVKEE